MLEGNYFEGRLLIRFKVEVNRQTRTELDFPAIAEKFDEWGVSVKHAYHGGLAGLYLVEGDFRVRDLLPVVLEDPAVKYAEPDYKVALDYQPNDPYVQSGTATADHLDKIGAFDAWDQTKGDPSLVIALIDTGLQMNHEDLSANLWTNPGEIAGNGVDDDGNGYKDDIHGWNFDSNNNNLSDWNAANDGHGTATTCAAAGVGDNGKGTAGVAYRCKFAVLKALQTGVSSAIEALQYAADMDFKVVNGSWHSFSSAQAISDAITEMNNKGILYVCTAANDDRNIDLPGNTLYPGCLTHPNIITVMSTDMSDMKSSDSSWGAVSVDLAAPGVDLYLAKAPSGYKDWTGTSAAAPVVAGACALLWCKYPAKTHIEIRQLILDNVDVVSSLTGLCATSGRLNIKEALDAGGPVPPAPEAEFSATPTSGKAPLTVSFTDETSGQVTSWYWDFGDVSVSDEQNPTHTYWGAGTYTVSLTANGPGGSDTETKTACITVIEGVLAEFVADKTKGIAPFTVVFTDLSDGSPTSWSWNFGDGGTSTQQNPPYTYNSAGTYTVTLTASKSGDSDTSTRTNYIEVLPPGSVVSEFTGSPRSGLCPLAVSFADQSEGTVTSWQWSFGDGATSNEQNPDHTYNTPGTYTVSLTVSGASNNDTETKADYITVAAPEPVKEDNKGGCSCSISGTNKPGRPADMLGYFLPVFLLVGTLYAIRLRRKGKAYVPHL
jgi:PKD repeat protein